MKEMAEYVFERDRNEFALGDTLDIKTGLILASLTFLAIQSGALVGAHLSLPQTFAQIISIVALVASGTLSVVELWPRSYGREATPDSYDEWISKLESFQTLNPSVHVSTENSVHEARLSAAKERVRINIQINKTKSTLMFWAFYCLTASFATNIATLAMQVMRPS